MTREDFYELQQTAAHLSDLPRVGVFSPARGGERKIFPNAMRLPRRRWNLNEPGPRRFDLLVAANVFMYSPDPARWFRHVLASCRYFLLLDVVRRRRSRHDEFGADGDRMRYAVGDARPRSESRFDLGALGDRLLGYRTYHGGATDYDDQPLHVLALFRGDLAEPILRLDDYPAAVGQPGHDLPPSHAILCRVEERELRYYLGIAPARVRADAFGFLNSLKHVIPAVQGLDFANSAHASILGEESGSQPYDVILGELRRCRRLLEDQLGRNVEAFIPPCNLVHRRLGRALVEAGYTTYLAETRIPGCSLRWIRSDFRGGSADYDADRRPDVVSLHMAWEADLVRQGDTHALERLLDDLAHRKHAERKRGAWLGELVAERRAT